MPLWKVVGEATLDASSQRCQRVLKIGTK